MGDTRAEPYNSVYVLDPHFQCKELVNVFNSPAGRAVMVQQDKSHVKTSTQPPNRNNIAKFIIESEDVTNGNLIQDLNTNANEDYQARLTRRLSRNRKDDNKSVSLDEQDLNKKSSLLDNQNPDELLDSKIFRYSSEKELLKGGRFSSEEKCDILRRMVNGFLSGWALGVGGGHLSRWRKRKSSDQLYMEASMALGIPCEMTDSCRCLECQCHYFDCGDSDSDTSDILLELSDGTDWDSPEEELQELQPPAVFYEENETLKEPQEEEIVEELKEEQEAESPCEDPPPPAAPAAAPIPGATVLEMAPSIEIAAGTPVILDHLLNNPMSCTIQ